MKESIGETIKNLRELKNYTQAYMADRLSMSVSGYGKIERNESELTINKLKQIAEILGVDYSKILDFDKSTVFNIYKNSYNTNLSGIVQNQQVNGDPTMNELLTKIITDNQDFKSYLIELMKYQTK